MSTSNGYDELLAAAGFRTEGELDVDGEDLKGRKEAE